MTNRHEHIDALLNLKEGWKDGEGVQPLVRVAYLAHALVDAVVAQGGPDLYIYPCVEGGIHVEWNPGPRDGIYNGQLGGMLTLFNTGKVNFWAEGNDNLLIEKSLTLDFLRVATSYKQAAAERAAFAARLAGWIIHPTREEPT